MADSKTKKEEEEKKKKAAEEAEKKKKAAEEEEKKKPKDPPLESSARRLERLLGGATSKDVNLYSNPSKIVKRWLGTSSGAAGKATLLDVVNATKALFDPESDVCAVGRQTLLDLEVLVPVVDKKNDDDKDKKKDENDDKMDTTTTTTATEDETKTVKFQEDKPKYLTIASCMEIESWLISLAVRILWKNSFYKEAYELVEKGISYLNNHLSVYKATNKGHQLKNSLFPLLARLYRYRSLVIESLPSQEEEETMTDDDTSSINKSELVLKIRQDMVRSHGTACLRRDVDTQATLLNLLLRDLLDQSQIEQAQKLLSNSNYPEETCSNNQLCRYLYYSGRIQALRLEYTAAYGNLSQCLRKAPTHTALGFRIAAQRLLVVVQLLMGEIPDRHVFFTKGMTSELEPYLAITQAVRRGDLGVFTNVVTKYTAQLQKDKTLTLIKRLEHVVVKAGLRRLHISYSRISLQDVADRLGLPSAKSAEFVVMKAVRDGVLDATIHHENKYVQSHDLIDVYATTEPSEAFHRRIAYCLTTHNDAVRGMRYPPDAYKKQLAASRGDADKKGSDDKTDEEMAKEIEEELEEDEY